MVCSAVKLQMSAHRVSHSQHMRLNYVHYPHHIPPLLGLSLLFMLNKDTIKIQFTARDRGNESEGGCVCVCVCGFFDDETRAC